VYIHFVYLTVGVLLLVLGGMLIRRGRGVDPDRRWRRRAVWLMVGVCGMTGGPALAIGAWMTACFYGPHPDPVTLDLFEGVRYQRLVLTTPRPQVIHIVEIDATHPGVDFVVTPAEVTPGDPHGHRLPARTTTGDDSLTVSLWMARHA